MHFRDNKWFNFFKIAKYQYFLNFIATSQALEDKKNKPKIAQIIMPNKHRFKL